MAIKKIKKSITETEYNKLMRYTKGNDSIKPFNRDRFLRIFSLLYLTGMRLNEVTQIKYSHIEQTIKTGETIIISHKTKRERILYFSPNGITEIKKYFPYTPEQLDNYVITSWGNPRKVIHPISLISLVNKYLHEVLGAGYSSHSFRQGIITEMGSRSINPVIIKDFVGHSSVRTTLGYIKPTTKDIKSALVR